MFRLKKMHLLVLRSFAGPFLAGFSVSVFLLVLSVLVKVQDQIFGKGFSLGVIMQLIGYMALAQVVEALALGILLSSLMTLGKMGEQYELAALKASGVSLWRVLKPLLVAGSILFFGAIMFSFYVRPWANLKLFTLLYDLKQAKPTFALKPGMFNTLIDGYTIRTTSREGDLLKGVHIYDHSQMRGATKVIVADSARMELDNRLLFLRMELYKGEQYEELPPQGNTNGGGPRHPFTRIAFDTLNYKLDLSGWGIKRTDENLFTSHQYMQNINQLARHNDSTIRSRSTVLERIDNQLDQTLAVHRWLSDSAQGLAAAAKPLPASMIDTAYACTSVEHLTRSTEMLRGLRNNILYHGDSMNYQIGEYRKFNRELHGRMTLPLAVLFFMVIGASLGSIIRKGGLGAPILAAIGTFVIFYLLMTSGKNMAAEGVLPVWLAMWMPIFVMVPLSLFLAYQSATDSGLLDLSAWRLLLVRIRRRLGLKVA